MNGRVFTTLLVLFLVHLTFGQVLRRCQRSLDCDIFEYCDEGTKVCKQPENTRECFSNSTFTNQCAHGMHCWKDRCVNRMVHCTTDDRDHGLCGQKEYDLIKRNCYYPNQGSPCENDCHVNGTCQYGVCLGGILQEGCEPEDLTQKMGEYLVDRSSSKVVYKKPGNSKMFATKAIGDPCVGDGSCSRLIFPDSCSYVGCDQGSCATLPFFFYPGCDVEPTINCYRDISPVQQRVFFGYTNNYNLIIYKTAQRIGSNYITTDSSYPLMLQPDTFNIGTYDFVYSIDLDPTQQQSASWYLGVSPLIVNPLRISQSIPCGKCNGENITSLNQRANCPVLPILECITILKKPTGTQIGLNRAYFGYDNQADYSVNLINMFSSATGSLTPVVAPSQDLSVGLPGRHDFVAYVDFSIPMGWNLLVAGASTTRTVTATVNSNQCGGQCGNVGVFNQGCDDGLFCTDDQCNIEPSMVLGTCSHTPKSCDDNNPGTNDMCDETNDACVNVLNHVCGNGQVEYGEQCDGDTGNELVVCGSDCQYEGEDPSTCSSPPSDLVMRGISRTNDLYLMRVQNDLHGGVVTLEEALQLSLNASNRVTKIVSSNLDQVGDSNAMIALGRCVNKDIHPTVPEGSTILNMIPSQDQSPVQMILPTLENHECCDPIYCTGLVLEYSDDYCGQHGLCDENQLLKIAINMSIAAHNLAMTEVSGSERVSCLNPTSAQVDLYQIKARQLLCCSASILKKINDFCTGGYDWDMDVQDPNVFTVMTGEYDVQSQTGMRTLTFEDYAPDYDHNDVVIRERQVCAYRRLVSLVQTFVNDGNDMTPIACYDLLHPVARGGGYFVQLFLAIEENINRNFQTLNEDQTRRTVSCIDFDRLVPEPIHQSLSEFKLFKNQPPPPPSGGVESNDWIHLNGILSAARSIKAVDTEASVGAKGTECWTSMSSLGSGSVDVHCIVKTPKGTDYNIIPDFLNVLKSSSLSKETYPNTLPNDAVDVHSAYDILFSWNILHRDLWSVKRNDVAGTGIPNLRFYLKNHSCKKNMELVDLDPQFVDPSGRPWAFIVPRGLWCWPREGIPLSMPSDQVGQCVFGTKTGRPCNDPSPNECPGTYCISVYSRSNSWVCAERNPAIPCTKQSQCPYGEGCYTRTNYCNQGVNQDQCNHPGGSYPNAIKHHDCLVEGCYDDGVTCSDQDCYSDSVVKWQLFPNTQTETHLYTVRIARYLPIDTCCSECYDLQNDVNHCGGCDTPCINENDVCYRGMCLASCPEDSEIRCNDVGTCIDDQSNVDHCGECDAQCVNSQGTTICNGGVCVPTCNTNYGDCDDDVNNGCETDLLISKPNCGECGHDCGNGYGCQDGECIPLDCLGADINTDVNHCGACDSPCSTRHTSSVSCVAGQCVARCEDGWGNCDSDTRDNGCETNIFTLNNCKACGHTCGILSDTSTPVCIVGFGCDYDCNEGYAQCDQTPGSLGFCTSIETTSNCGTCGHVCSTAHSDTVCTLGTCILACQQGYEDCNNNIDDGCEQDIFNTASQCGSCNNVCPTPPFTNYGCNGGQCYATCIPGYYDINNDMTDGCEYQCTPTMNTELCNGIDDNCNGQIDEGFGSVSCGVGGCTITIENECVNGETRVCVPKASSPEICNGIDDDCNNQIDDITAFPCGLDVGTCVSGVATCNENYEAICFGSVGPTYDRCNGLDDDCDGIVDNSGSCPNGIGSVGTCNGTYGCTYSCLDGYGDCDANPTTCETMLTNVLNCGGCGVRCPITATNALYSSCVDQTCVLSCQTPYKDCDKRVGTGCETNTNNDLFNCGACNNTCYSNTPQVLSSSCLNGVCKYVCQTNYQNCNNNGLDGCESNRLTDHDHCGSCLTQCSSNQDCVLGQCASRGLISVTSTWSPTGDGDLHILTPLGEVLYYGSTTDSTGGIFDIDSQTGNGPENVYWPTTSTPATGNYYVCFVPYDFPDGVAFVTTSINIKRSGHNDITATKTISINSDVIEKRQLPIVCSPSPTSPFYVFYVTTFMYP